jgi:hypothetical protein
LNLEFRGFSARVYEKQARSGGKTKAESGVAGRHDEKKVMYKQMAFWAERIYAAP